MCHNLRDTLPFALFPNCFTLLYKCKHDPSIATGRFPGQELHDSLLKGECPSVSSPTVKI
jgi:hypothetical protein